MTDYFRIPFQKEVEDAKKLAGIIKKDEFMDGNTLIVTCSPDYSSISSQIINHELSKDNSHELYEQLFMEMPYPTMSQVYNREMGTYELYDRYLQFWMKNYIDSSSRYLFFDTGVLRGKNFAKLKLSLKDRIEKERIRFACLYLQEESAFIPDYYVEKFSFEKQGGLIFEWENPLNPNWNY
jgi:hypothetical protein